MSDDAFLNSILSSSGVNFHMLMDDGAVLTRDKQPCYGELRKYKKTHGIDADWDENKPSDLHHPFPKSGNPLFIGIGFMPKLIKLFNSTHGKNILDLYLNKNSPWKNGLDNPTLVHKDNSIVGFINGTDVDPTTFVQLLMNIVRFNDLTYYTDKEISEILEPDIEQYKKILVINYLINNKYCVFDNYVQLNCIDIDKFKTGTPNILYKRKLKDRGDYNRKDIHTLFAPSDKNKGNILNLNTIFTYGKGISKIIEELKHV